jgi:hypothetical protein
VQVYRILYFWIFFSKTFQVIVQLNKIYKSLLVERGGGRERGGIDLEGGERRGEEKGMKKGLTLFLVQNRFLNFLCASPPYQLSLCCS